ncbi:D-alanyl-D-alanine carboxypeptidase/D-alanyl-D-alanine-endopeptidase [Pedobacter sp. HMF7647]|uniref:D-alanyl-D-alanine carboxypeptidase/D-alanyl-D-alanine-endopeptidase n=1 Tax=Hufsiella arboris TaxID=2695275 RepID=A0A7K1YEK3_9SPHI|nr:D-alanyl-D-alanine carboxypeptidase/D-alanyl-D-alanine-endopeptidase [Hufsiella arboris]MXV53037.1 D-alanyl-D-alanine carboxypeptidase/D-alanyl-D-alanine-endopeptidase [Hufsiella arboris]
MKKLALLFFLVLSLDTFAQTITQKIERAYAKFESDSQFKYATTSLTVLNAETGEIVFSKNSNMGLASASTLKTVTSATAFYLLGPNFTYQTTLGYSGVIDASGTLNGDLIITGAGDPTFGSERYQDTKPEVILKKFTDAVRQSGIKQINGRVISDDHLFGTQTLPTGWIWQDIGNYYGAGPNSLTWRENQLDLILRPGTKVGDPVQLVRTEPALTSVQIVNELTTGKSGSGDEVYAFSSPYSNIIYLRGTYGIDLEKTIAASIPDPALTFAAEFKSQLNKSGMKVSGLETTTRILSASKQPFSPPSKIIANQTSPDLTKIVYWFNQKSINLYGEHLVKTMALKAGKEVTTANGVEIVKDFWRQRAGIDENSMNTIDGSGLSPGTRITTLTMAKVLQTVKKEPWFKYYFESLPVYNGMRMKSGTINDALAYAGYQTSSSGVPLVFSFIVNNYNGSSKEVRQKMFAVLDQLK